MSWTPADPQLEAGMLELARLRDHRVGASSTHPGQYAVYFYPSEDYWTECGPYPTVEEAAGAIPELQARAVLEAAFEGTAPLFLTREELERLTMALDAAVETKAASVGFALGSAGMKLDVALQEWRESERG